MKTTANSIFAFVCVINRLAFFGLAFLLFTFEFQKQLKFKAMSKNTNKPGAEISEAGNDLINAAKAGETGNPSQVEGAQGETTGTADAGQPAAPLIPPVPDQGKAPEAPITAPPPVRQQGRMAAIGGINLEILNQSAKGAPTEQLRSLKGIIDGELASREPAQTESFSGNMYGADSITATKNGVKTTFTKIAWDQLPKDKKGWKEDLKTPPEVQALNK